MTFVPPRGSGFLAFFVFLFLYRSYQFIADKLWWFYHERWGRLAKKNECPCGNYCYYWSNRCKSGATRAGQPKGDR